MTPKSTTAAANTDDQVQELRERSCREHVWVVGYIGATLNIEYCSRCGKRRSAEGTALNAR